MAKKLRKQLAKLTVRRNGAMSAKVNRSNNKNGTGGSYADSKHAAGINMPGSMSK